MRSIRRSDPSAKTDQRVKPGQLANYRHESCRFWHRDSSKEKFFGQIDEPSGEAKIRRPWMRLGMTGFERHSAAVSTTGGNAAALRKRIDRQHQIGLFENAFGANANEELCRGN